MQIYHYSPVTGEYLGSTVASANPLESGEYLIPANAVTVAPDAPTEGSVMAWSGAAWEELVDNRGTYYDADRVVQVITDLGEAVPEGWTAEPREDTVPEAMGKAIAAIQAYCDYKDVQPFLFEEEYYKVTDAVLNTINYCTLLGTADADPLPMNDGKWDNYDASVSTSMTLGDLKDLYKAGYEVPAYNYGIMKVHIAAVMSLTTVSAIEAYDYTIGWH